MNHVVNEPVNKVSNSKYQPFSSKLSLPNNLPYSKPHISITDLSIKYNEKLALTDVSLPIFRSSITALVGPSGCGKSSFLSTLSRMSDLIPGCKVDGNILLNDVDVYAPATNVLSLRREVGMIFQRPNPFPFSIRENIAMPLKEHGVKDHDERDNRIREALEDVGLWSEVKDRLATSALALSGGQQQRLCIARAIALRPSILLMDEPCSALDPMSSRVIEELILQLLPKYTVVIVTHNLAQARRISNFTAVFWNTNQVGTIVEFGPTHQVFSNPTHELTKAYLSGAQG